MKHDVAGAEVHGRCQAELEIGVQPEFAQHADVEAGVPAVLVGSDDGVHLTAVVQRDDLRAGVYELKILEMGTHEDAKVEWAQVGIGPVLHRAVLSLHSRQAGKERYDNR